MEDPDQSSWTEPAPEDRRPGRAIGWNLLLSLDLALVGFLILAGMALLLTGNLSDADPASDPEAGRGALWSGVIAGLVMFGVIPVMWLAGTRVKPLAGTLAYLKLHRPGRGIALGVGLTGYPLAAALLLSIALEVFGFSPETGTDPFAAVDWPLAVGISLGAGVGEEILFRGLLMPWIGVWGQAILFGLAHASAGWLSVGFTFGFGLWAGYLVRRGWSLWALITAHTLYDFVLLAWGILGAA